ncbi:MAG: peptidyl-prolyl cis-trans isomerase [Myxococcota bacterium]
MARRSRQLVAVLLALAACGSDDGGATGGPTPSATAVPPGGLSPEQAAQVLAKVGDRTITLGDYAATLERMNQLDRLRYQTDKRRLALLNELIDLELLASEARRLGLDREPAVQEAIRQVLREALLEDALRSLPKPNQIPASEVKAYYEAHRDDFVEPERRRVSAIVVYDAQSAAKVLAKVKEMKSPGDWGDLYYGWSIDQPLVRNTAAPPDLAGDLGIVAPPGHPEGGHPMVPEPVREAVFTLRVLGDVHPEAIAHEGKLYIARLTGKSQGHTRSLKEADRSIRLRILQEKRTTLETKLEAELKEEIPIQIDREALEKLRVEPAPSSSP